MKRIKIIIRGAVQGVGFRPFVYRLASEMNLTGWVINSSQGVFIEAENKKDVLDKFLLRLQIENPPRSYIQSLEFSYLDALGYKGFEIRKSKEDGNKSVLLLPDIATCNDCLKEIFDPENRRYLYPFTNCTNCGPRYTIIEELPYDRRYTTMKDFVMCEQCKEEYENPKNRRFHAQPNACPNCGPNVELWNSKGNLVSSQNDALIDIIDQIKKGKIAAIKGIGGFHLICDARNEESVKKLRKRKNREEKPFALMFPNLESIKKYCKVSEFEERSLKSPEAPIVLLEKNNFGIAFESSSQNNPYIGVMLPYTPLHHILMKGLGFPVIATSGNISDEPICTNEYEAVQRLGNIADIFLVNNRAIVRHVDDSIVRIILDREMIIRRARGYAPLPIRIKNDNSMVLAVGAHLKNTIALNIEKNVFLSQHIGDLESNESYKAFRRVINDLIDIYQIKPQSVICDLHPDYLSTQFAQKTGLQVKRIQHHFAHIFSCIAENEIEGDVLGVSWDGTGYGSDGTIWGGEFLVVENDKFYRAGNLRTFSLPGGEIAIKEIWRSEIGLMYELYGDKIFDDLKAKMFSKINKNNIKILKTILNNKINSPLTSSAGRLFDSIASLTGITDYSSYEGKAAMQLEFAIKKCKTNEFYPFEIKINKKSDNRLTYIADWEPMINSIKKDIKKTKIGTDKISAKFHNTLTEMVIKIAKKVGKEKIVLSGGCFQNKYLLVNTIRRLTNKKFKVYWHQRVPTNDGGISLGQIYYHQKYNKNLN